MVETNEVAMTRARFEMDFIMVCDNAEEVVVALVMAVVVVVVVVVERRKE